jgi:hypothetical protein
MEAERHLMNNGGKLISAVRVTVSPDGATSIRFKYLYHKAHVFQYENTELGFQWARSELHLLEEDVVLNLFMAATEHGNARMRKCERCSVISLSCQKNS